MSAMARIDHTNSGMRCSAMPGARSFCAVTRKLIAPAVVEMPMNTTPMPQKSTARSWLNCGPVSGT
jgi:hypothetical protein